MTIDSPPPQTTFGSSKERIRNRNKPVKLVKDGSEYGGWTYNAASLTKDSIIYSVGVGEDTTFDEGIVKRFGLEIWLFDPTPKALKHVGSRGLLQDNHFHMTAEGLSTTQSRTKFTMPANPDHVSLREGSHSDGGQEIELDINTLENWMKLNGHSHLDLLKIDIEGSEYAVLEDWVRRDFFPMDQLLVEWHFRWLEDKSRHDRLLRGLQEKGWKLVYSQNEGQEDTYVRTE
jgi:FkbM family methyltransferase